ncbi:hypothetical protein ATJ88_2469 [Isoptericola jiangsuensis]|uniref:Uncharacterized protein n=1 Tax=Isoptericola jiangsuensis TaxID=548579 RepID=A0A2A9EZM7_9MICO|nr:hypothetical protein [Isoptericola jiangsuensis]PFG43762.1 hypothetical protein ATJ88_2469 [Isoptericola jiangsuensis]
MSERRHWTTAADLALAACGVAWLLGMGADEASGDIVAVGAAWVFLVVGAPWAVARAVHLHWRWRDDGRPFAQAPRTLVLAAGLAGVLLLAGMTIGGSIGGTVVNLAGLALLALGVGAFLAAFTPLGSVMAARARRRAIER